jgi:hypothetical protein
VLRFLRKGALSTGRTALRIVLRRVPFDLYTSVVGNTPQTKSEKKRIVVMFTSKSMPYGQRIRLLYGMIYTRSNHGVWKYINAFTGAWYAGSCYTLKEGWRWFVNRCTHVDGFGDPAAVVTAAQLLFLDPNTTIVMSAWRNWPYNTPRDELHSMYYQSARCAGVVVLMYYSLLINITDYECRKGITNSNFLYTSRALYVEDWSVQA